MPAAFALSKYSSGKPCKRQHSLGVKRRMRTLSANRLFSCQALIDNAGAMSCIPPLLYPRGRWYIATPCLSAEVSVKLGSPGSFIQRPFCRRTLRSGVRTGATNTPLLQSAVWSPQCFDVKALAQSTCSIYPFSLLPSPRSG